MPSVQTLVDVADRRRSLATMPGFHRRQSAAQQRVIPTSAMSCACADVGTNTSYAHALELLARGIPMPLIQHQLGHAYLSTTGTYLQGISSGEIISPVHAQRAAMMHASAGLAL